MSAVRLDDMRLFAEVAAAGSLSGAARALEMPKQTVSRRLGELERALGVALVQRTTRRLRLTDVGQAYAARCSEVSRLAREANLSLSSEHDEPRGTLRLTADTTFGETLLPGVLSTFAMRFEAVRMHVELTNRIVDLVEEGFDAAFRVGPLNDSTLVGRRIAPARMCFAASPGYIEARGTPRSLADLERHDCVELSPQGGTPRWPVLVDGELQAVWVRGRVRVNTTPLALRAALAGLGIAALPAFVCAADIERGALVEVLEAHAGDVGGIHVVYPSHRVLTARVRRLIDVSVECLAQPDTR